VLKSELFSQEQVWREQRLAAEQIVTTRDHRALTPEAVKELNEKWKDCGTVWEGVVESETAKTTGRSSCKIPALRSSMATLLDIHDCGVRPLYSSEARSGPRW
jgi:hypothetical protein